MIQESDFQVAVDKCAILVAIHVSAEGHTATVGQSNICAFAYCKTAHNSSINQNSLQILISITGCLQTWKNKSPQVFQNL